MVGIGPRFILKRKTMTVNKNLIYDVGMHTGEDTEYYLKKGFKVVAFEANPELISFCKEKFIEEIDKGDLIIKEGAIVDQSKTTDKTIKFYKNQANSVWGTVVPDWSIRNEKFGAESNIIEVPTVDFSECLKEFGIPHYLKVDIEGMDLVCLTALLPFKNKPPYISIESEKVDFEKLNKEFELLEALGYDKFKIVNQAEITGFKEPPASSEGKTLNYTFREGSSGLFGTDLPTPWINKKRALQYYKWIFYGYRLWGDNSKIAHWFVPRWGLRIINRLLGRNLPGWHDTHARHAHYKA